MGSWSIRRYAGTLLEACGILAVERETFGECPYTPEELRVRLSAPEQRPWLAEADGQVVGFLCGLRTGGLWGPRLEADLLAVHPAWQGQGIASALLAALRRDATDVPMLRSVIRPANPASERAFARAGFEPSQAVHDLLIYRIRGLVPRPLPAWDGAVRPLQGPQEAEQLAALAPDLLPEGRQIWAAHQAPGLTLLAAAARGTIAGGVELLEVHTLLYSGLWLESLCTRPGERRALPALAAAAVEAAKARALDAVGCLVPQEAWVQREALLTEGFVPLESYRIWTAAPLAGEGADP